MTDPTRISDDQHNNAPAVPDDILARACNLAGLPYETFLKIKAYLPAPQADPAPAVPQGWKLVPIEPTLEMMSAAVSEICYKAPGGFTRIDGPGRTWAAMLAATPAPAPAQEPAYWGLRNKLGDCDWHTPSRFKMKQSALDDLDSAFPERAPHQPYPLFANTAPAQEVTLSLAAEDVHAAFAKNFPKSRISQAWINFAADIAQAIAERAAKPAQEVTLTDDEINSIWSDGHPGSILSPWGLNKIRAIIAALRAKGGKL